MNRKVWVAGAIVLLVMSCKKPTDPVTSQPQATSLRGTVSRSDNLQPVPQVIVFEEGGSARDTTANDGTFSLDYVLSAPFSSRVIASRSGFQNDTASFTLTPGRDTTINLTIVADSSSPPTGVPGLPASIFLVSASHQTISIRGTGGNETATMLFEVRDSLGNAISDSVVVSFSLQGAPNAGEYITPTTAATDKLTGRVSTKVTSGFSAGVVQVFASITVGTTVIKSRPVRLIIAGGFPVPNGVSISAEKFNLPAVFDNITDAITVVVADKDGNPVENAGVHFGTNGGRIDAGGLSDRTGSITSTLRTGGLTPPASGVVTVSAQTVDSSGNPIVKTIPIVFSGATTITAPSATVILPDSGEYGFNYQVRDAVGNPLTAGTRITVKVAGDVASELEVLGDSDIEIPDTQNPFYTSFSARVRDPKTGGKAGTFAIVIEVTSQNGNARYSFPGVLLSSGSSVFIPPGAREPAQIEASAPSRITIDVSGVGGVETSVLTFTVKDSAGVPFDASKRIFVDFTLEFIPNSYVGGASPPKILPPSDSTDNGGRARVTVVSGKQSGVAQVVGRVFTSLGVPIVARSKQIVIRAADPDQSHFSLFTDAYTFAHATPGVPGSNFFVHLADTFSNPTPGRTVYWHSWAGNIQAEATSNTDGSGRVSFLGGNPLPTVAGTAAAGRLTYEGRPGVLWVVSQTTGKNGVQISDSLRVCWAVGPITVTGVPGATVNVPQAGASAVIPLSIRDGRNNPLPVGTTISVQVDYTTDVSTVKFAVSGDLASDLPFTMPNGPYVVDPGPGVTDFDIRVVDLSVGGATIGQSMIIKITITAPNIGTKVISFNAVVV